MDKTFYFTPHLRVLLVGVTFEDLKKASQAKKKKKVNKDKISVFWQILILSHAFV